MTHQEFKELFEMHFAQVRKYVFYRSGDTEVATDIAQETFLKVWEKRNSVQVENVKGLLFKMAGDLFVSWYRKEKRSFGFFNGFVLHEKGESPEEIYAFKQLQQRYDKALQTMPEKQRTTFLLSRAENMKYREIAEMLGISLKAVEKRMTQALSHMQIFLNEE